MRYKFNIWQYRINFIFTLLFVLSCLIWVIFADTNTPNAFTNRLEPITVLFGGLAGLSTLIWFNPSYKNKRIKGRESFNFKSNNGIYYIGKEPQLFGTKWSSCSGSSIYLYSDHTSIKQIALAKGVYNFNEIKNPTVFDFSSRSIVIQENEIAVIVNTEGDFALIRVIDVKDERRQDDRNELTIEWIINPNKKIDFS